MRRKRTWTENELIFAVANSTSYRMALQRLGLRATGGNYDQLKKYLAEYSLSTDHFKGRAWNKGLRGVGKPIIPLKDILKKNSTYQSYKLKKRLFENSLKDKSCEECGWARYSEDGRLPLELDHINGDRHDNRLKNLRILCPNCHSLKSTHRGMNRRKQARVVK